MGKYRGAIGFVSYVEEPADSGIYVEKYNERSYTGDITRNTRRLENDSKVNDDVVVSNEISIVCDPYAFENFHNIRYATYMKTKWKVTSVEVRYPRLNLTLGGEYHAEPNGTSQEAERNGKSV